MTEQPQADPGVRRHTNVATAVALVLLAAFALGFWGKLSVLRPSGWLASSWLPYVLGAWVVIRSETKPARAAALAAATILGTYWAVEIGLGLRFSPIDWAAPIDSLLLLAAAVVGVSSSACVLLRNRWGATVEAILAASLSTALVVLAAAVLLGSYDRGGTFVVVLGAAVVAVLSWHAVRQHLLWAAATAIVTATIALLVSDAASYLNS